MKYVHYAKNALLKSTKIFHYRQAHSENLYFFVFFEVPLLPTAPEAGLSQKVVKNTQIVFFSARDSLFFSVSGGSDLTVYRPVQQK